MHSFFSKRSVVTLGLLAAALATLTPDAAQAKPRPGKGAHGFRLFARTLGAMTVNRVYCGLSATGEICVDSTNSSVIGGGFWPKGTPDQYVFNSGLQVAGTIDAGAGFDWAGDTTGAFFFDPKGTTQHGEQVAPIYNMTNPEDLAAVSDSQASGEALAARVPIGDANETLFYPLLRGRSSASQGDVWFLTWDGNPTQNAGRSHPLGILVEQRGLGWNFPSGNEDIIYFVYTFYNVTAAASSGVYASIRPGMRELVEARGDLFQSRNEAAFGVDIPDGGYTISNLFAAFSADMDVSSAGSNYSSVNVPFALGYVYDNTFRGSTGWTFDPGIFGSPFFAGAGFVGVKYLKSPINPTTGQQVGLTLFSNTINGGAFDDAQNTIQLYRYLSGNISVAAGDAACNHNPITEKICYVNTGAPDDMRFFQSSGPLTLAPGEFQSIVVAYIFAAPVATGACVGAGTCDLTPGNPSLTNSLTALNGSGLNPVDSVAGYRGFQGDLNSNGVPEQTEYEAPVSNSLMGKALTAQTVFNFNFLLPFAPDAPEFFTVPGDNQVSVLWRPSPTEASGDPFFTIASQVTTTDTLGNPVPNPLYDPNYRQFDVEGYRVYRGRVDNPNELQLLAQFDYSGTFISDFAAQVNPTAGCAPELGVNVFTPILDTLGNPVDSTPACPIDFDSVAPGLARTQFVDVPLVGELTQVKLTGGRDKLANNTAIFLQVDTAMTGSGSTGQTLEDTDVPFVYVDRTARNNIRYFYSVVAFDVNSFQSGPSSLESPRNTKPTTASHTATNTQSTLQLTQVLTGRGTNLNYNAPAPALDPGNLTFSGPFPPANGWQFGFVSDLPEVLSGAGSFSAHLDSLSLGNPWEIPTSTYFFTATTAGGTFSVSVPVDQSFVEPTADGASTPFLAATVDASASRFGGGSDFSLYGQVSMTLPGSPYANGFGRIVALGAQTTGFPELSAENGPRWFEGDNETTPHPNGNNLADVTADPNLYSNAGSVAGVTVIHEPQSYLQGYPGVDSRELLGVYSGAARAADFKFYWGAGGAVDSVIDITHNVPVPFDSSFGASWGFLTPASATSNASLDASTATVSTADFWCVDPAIAQSATGNFTCAADPAYKLVPVATLAPVAVGGAEPVVPLPGQGFGLYMPGHAFIFGGVAAIPAAGTVWTLRTYTGAITADNTFFEQPRPLTAVGVDLQAQYTAENQVLAATDDDLSRVHTVPDPYYVTNQFEQTTDTKIIKFVNLPADCIIRIYSSSGVLVSLLEHHSAAFGGAEDWNVRNRNNQVVASGVYFYHVESGDARRVGRFTVVNFAE